MRPNTLSETMERLRSDNRYGAALAEFVDAFLLAPDEQPLRRARSHLPFPKESSAVPPVSRMT